VPRVRVYGDPESVAKRAVEELRAEIVRKLDEALDGALRILDAAKNRALTRIERELGEALREAEERVRAERATYEARLRVEEMNARNEWIERAVNEALKKLREALGEDEYRRFLEALVRNAAEALRDAGEMIIYPVESDRPLLEKIVAEAQLPIRASLAAESVEGYGGFVASSPDGSVRLDYRIESVLAEAVEEARAAAAAKLFG